MSDLPAARCGLGNDPEHRPHDYAVTGEWPVFGPHRHCPGGPTTGEQTPDVEALAEVLKADGWLGHDDELEMYDLRNIAATILASDWLAAREQAAERRGAVRALREAADEMRDDLQISEFDGAVLWLKSAADRIEAGDD